MIYITEKTTKNIPGDTSLYIYFGKYDPTYVELIKQFPERFYIKESKEWEISILQLANFIDTFCTYDDITFNFIEENNNDDSFIDFTLNDHKTKLFPYQEDSVKYGLNHDKWLLLDEPGLGKAVSLDTLVYTPEGPKCIQDIKKGDIVFDMEGKHCNVISTYQYDNLDMYRVIFEDNSYIDCCIDHQWLLDDSRVVNTKYIIDHINSENISIPLCDAISFNNESCDIDAYTYGKSLYNVQSIPDNIVYSSIDFKIQLLKGLFDNTDYIIDNNTISFKFKNKEIIDKLQEIIESLSGICYISDNMLTIAFKDHSIVEYIFGYSIKTKSSRQISSVIKISNTIGKCLSVDSPSKTYICTHFIVTHNTIQLLYLAEELKQRYDVKHCLIICGLNALKINWMHEIQKHSTLSCMILGQRFSKKTNRIKYGGNKEKIADLQNPIEEFFVITNIESLRDDKIIDLINHGPNKFDIVFVDEIHVAKNDKSQQGKNLLGIHDVKYKVAATGTAIMNNPLDLYVPLKWVGAEKKSYSKFKYFYCEYAGKLNNILIGFKNLELLKYQLNKYSLRRKRDLLNLPEKTVIPEYISMSDDQQSFYDNIVNGIKDEVDKVNLNTSSILALVNRLRQATACPSILTSQSIPSAKIDRCIDLISQIISNNQKVVVFSTFKQTLDEISKRLDNNKFTINHGEIDELTIANNIESFQNNPNSQIFLATWQKCGTGFTLTAATYMIFIDTPWTMSAFEQACDRIHRIGTNQPVTIYNLITVDTIDERVLEILHNKEALSDYIIDDNISIKNIDRLKKFILNL